MKTYREFILEAQGIAVRRPTRPNSSAPIVNNQQSSIQQTMAKIGQNPITRFGSNLLNPLSGPLSNATTSVVRNVVASRLPKPIQPVVQNVVAPAVGMAAGLARRAPHVSAVISTFNQRTAAGRVPVRGSDGKIHYMDK